MAAAGGSGNNPLHGSNQLVRRAPPPLPLDRVRGSIGAFVAIGGRTFDVEVPATVDAPAAGANPSPGEKPSDEPAAAETPEAEKAAEVLAAVRKAQAVASENPANFHQAAAVYIFGGGTVKLQTSFPRPENISRMTADEMKLAWEKAEENISKTEKLVCHFTDLEGAGWILGTESPGFRASKVGQGGGGVYVSSAGPHQLDWEQYHGGKFRETTGKALWGEKWQELLEGAVCANKVDMVFFIRIPEVWYTQAAPIPGRPLARVIPSSTLYEEDGEHYLQKNRIVKSYVLKRGVGSGAPHLIIKGEEAPEQKSVSMKLKFAALSGLLILAQLMAVVAIVVATIAPGCQTNNDCDRAGTFCTPPNGWYDGGCSLLKQMDPANTLSLDQIAESCAGRGWFIPGDEGNALVSGGGRCQFCGDDYIWGLPDNSTAFCANEEIWRTEFCDVQTGWAPPAAAPGDTAPRVKTCAHPACRACKDVPGFGVAAKVWMNQVDRPDGDQMWGVTDWFTTFTGTIGSMKTSDGFALVVCSMIVSFSLAGEIKDIKLVQITTRARGTKMPFWRAYMLGCCYFRQYAIVPGIVLSVPVLVMFDGGSAKNIALNTVGALFLLSADNEAFEFALPQSMRQHTEEFGRAEINEDELKRIETAKQYSWPVLTFAMVMPILLAWYNVLSCDGRDHYSSPGCTDTNATLLIAYAITLGLLLNLLSGIAEAWVVAESEGRSKSVSAPGNITVA